MNLVRLYKQLDTALAVARVQMEGAPGVCTAQWFEATFAVWEASQRRVRARFNRLHSLHYKVGKKIEKSLSKA